jgi:hypothetical protein
LRRSEKTATTPSTGTLTTFPARERRHVQTGGYQREGGLGSDG